LEYNLLGAKEKGPKLVNWNRFPKPPLSGLSRLSWEEPFPGQPNYLKKIGRESLPRFGERIFFPTPKGVPKKHPPEKIKPF